jgi:transcription elongation factor Elf1
MPLAGPISEGEKFFCPKCGALYSVTRRQAAKKEVNIAKCVVCLQIMDKTDSTAVPVYKLIHRPEDA